MMRPMRHHGETRACLLCRRLGTGRGATVGLAIFGPDSLLVNWWQSCTLRGDRPITGLRVPTAVRTGWKGEGHEGHSHPRRSGSLARRGPERAAQGIATSYQELKLLVRPGDAVTLVDSTGQKVSGRITDLSASALAMTVDGRSREWRETEVSTITQRRQDSLTNGALIGLGVGAASAAVGGAVWAANTVADDTNAGDVAVVLAFYGGIGAAIGVGVDAMITKHYVIFDRRPGSGVTVSVAPQLGFGRAGARLSIGF
jgi:hypothetical protein